MSRDIVERLNEAIKIINRQRTAMNKAIAILEENFATKPFDAIEVLREGMR